MTDRELLEAAAKAAGIDYDVDSVEQMWTPSIPENGGKSYLQNLWNPLKDDGDALRLAVTLRIVIDFWLSPHLGMAGTVNFGKYKDAIFISEQDIQESTRRAIVRAAAEIWRKK